MKEIDFPIEVIKNKNQKIQKLFIKGVEVPTKTLFNINHQIVSGGLDEVTLKFYTDDFYIWDHEEEKK